MGVPTLGCKCAVCLDAVKPHSRNRRTRPSVHLAFNEHSVLIDTGPDFHAQAIREQLGRVDAVFYTHHHADHILGMDDLRPLSFRQPAGIQLYADEPTSEILRTVFQYTFRTEDRYPTSARVSLETISADAAVELFGAVFRRVPVIHGRETITGYRFGSAAYLTDMSDLPDASLPLLEGLDVLILDALRPQPHPSHSHLAKSLEYVTKLQPHRAFFTHMGHELDHEATQAILPPHVRLAYDGLKIDFDIAPPLEPSTT